MREIKNSGFSLKLDLVILAMGFLHVRDSTLLKELNLEYEKSGNIKISSNYHTSVRGVFAAGDAHFGASLVVQAIQQGRRAAKAINEYLMIEDR